jgi:hypothetical protein
MSASVATPPSSSTTSQAGGRTSLTFSQVKAQIADRPLPETNQLSLLARA